MYILPGLAYLLMDVTCYSQNHFVYILVNISRGFMHHGYWNNFSKYINTVFIGIVDNFLEIVLFKITNKYVITFLIFF